MSWYSLKSVLLNFLLEPSDENASPIVLKERWFTKPVLYTALNHWFYDMGYPVLFFLIQAKLRIWISNNYQSFYSHISYLIILYKFLTVDEAVAICIICRPEVYYWIIFLDFCWSGKTDNPAHVWINENSQLILAVHVTWWPGIIY